MRVFSLMREQEWNPKRHVEKILDRIGAGDVSLACWEPGQISPYHCHPDATEVYFCVEGGGKMRTPSETIDVVPGVFVVHPAGEVHEYANGPHRTLLFRVAGWRGGRGTLWGRGRAGPGDGWGRGGWGRPGRGNNRGGTPVSPPASPTPRGPTRTRAGAGNAGKMFRRCLGNLGGGRE